MLTLPLNHQKIACHRIADLTESGDDPVRYLEISMIRLLPRVSVILIAVVALYSFSVQPIEATYVAMAPAAQANDVNAIGGIGDINDLGDFSNRFTNPLGAKDMAIANGLSGSVAISEWLGPLAPIAISPFFGITLLAGISQFGSESLPFNQFISNNPILSNPATFWIFLGLTILTSLPRFTKVSKPAAQAIDQLETYAAIITIVLLRVLATSGAGAGTEEMGPVVMQAGMFAFTADALMSIAAIVNIIVINTIKFFFEVSVWLIPFPMVDAALEVANKSACAALMGVYAYNPTLATIINLLIFAACLVAFRWVNRRTAYLRTLLFDPIWTMISPGYAVPKDRLTVFPQHSIGPFKAKSKLVMQPTESGWSLTQHRILLPAKEMILERSENNLAMSKGLIANRIELADGNRLLFSRRHSGHLTTVAEKMDIVFESANEELLAVV